MQPKTRDGSIIASDFDNEAQAWVFKVAGMPELRLARADVSQQVEDTALVYGMNVRVTRAAAKSAGASAEEKYRAMKTLIDHYASGTEEWDMPRGPTVRRPDAFVLAAIAELRGCSVEEVMKLATVSASSKNVELTAIVESWAAIPKVREKAAELRAKASGVSEETVGEMERELGI